MPRADAAYVAQFGTHSAWNSLHDSVGWQPPTPEQVEVSDAVQRFHFNAFFHPAHHTFLPLSPAHCLSITLRLVHDFFRRWKSDCIWLRLHGAVRRRVLLKRHVRAFRAAAARHAVATLEGWLAHWRETEAQMQETLRGWLRCGKPVATEWTGPVPLAHVMTSICEEVKVQVLWELYWLLHAQLLIQRHAYWARWHALKQLRQKVRWQQALSLDIPQPQSKVLDFWNDEPVSLRAVNAALFVMALQPPRFRCRPGHEITLKELLLFAHAPEPAFQTVEGDVRLRHVSGVAAAFLASPLCTEAAALRRRLAKLLPLIPRRTWCPTPARTASPTEERVVNPPGGWLPPPLTLPPRHMSSVWCKGSSQSPGLPSPLLPRHKSLSMRAVSAARERTPTTSPLQPPTLTFAGALGLPPSSPA
eukprot:EG_transcript_14339